MASSKLAGLKAKAPAAEAPAPAAAPAAVAPPPAPRPTVPKGILDAQIPFVRITKARTALYEAKLDNGMVVIVYTPEKAGRKASLPVAIDITGLGV